MEIFTNSCESLREFQRELKRESLLNEYSSKLDDQISQKLRNTMKDLCKNNWELRKLEYLTEIIYADRKAGKDLGFETGFGIHTHNFDFYPQEIGNRYSVLKFISLLRSNPKYLTTVLQNKGLLRGKMLKKEGVLEAQGIIYSIFGGVINPYDEYLFLKLMDVIFFYSFNNFQLSKKQKQEFIGAKSSII